MNNTVRVTKHACHRFRERVGTGLVPNIPWTLRQAVASACREGTFIGHANRRHNDAVLVPLRIGSDHCLLICHPDDDQPHPKQLVIVTIITKQAYMQSITARAIPMDANIAADQLERRANQLADGPAANLRKLAAKMRGVG